MKVSLQAFMANLIDYAGLFPPTSLPLDEAIRNYAVYRSEKDAWMLGPFIIPISQLEKLAPYVSLFSRELPLSLSVIGRKSAKEDDWQRGLQEDLALVEAFRQRHGDCVKIGTLEQLLPPIELEQELLEAFATETARHNLNTFCELAAPLDVDWEVNLLKTLDCIAAHNEQHSSQLGFKLRTGGVSAEMFPLPAQVASAIIGCRDRGIAMKFTAGLHHPIRMYRDEVGTRMHGFLNVFTAGMAAYVHHLDVVETTQILADEDPNHFSFTTEALSWRDLVVKASAIEEVREKLLCSYGCCSFDEPRQDLKELGILYTEDDLSEKVFY